MGKNEFLYKIHRFEEVWLIAMGYTRTYPCADNIGIRYSIIIAPM